MTLKSQEMLERICDGIIAGKSLRQICEPEGMPAPSTVCLWLSQDEDFAERYARAKEIQMENLAEEIIEIAEDGTNDYVAIHDPDNPGYRLNGEHVQRSRLRIDTRKWLMSKLAPKKYGDKVAVQADVDASLTVTVKQFTLDKP